MEATQTMEQAKASVKKGITAEVVGLMFQAPTGATGKVIAELSPRGKPQAEFTCTEANCTETHVREISDWHQCGKCRTHKKSKSRSGGGSSTGNVSVGGNRLMKILETDDEETRALKEQNNEVVTQLLAKEKEEREAKKAQDAEARKAKQESEKAARELEKAAKQKQALRENLERIAAVAKEKGLQVSPKTIADAAEAEAELDQTA